MADSSTVSAGDTATAAQYNNLRKDVLDATSGHDHSGAADHGVLIPPSSLDSDGSTSGQVPVSTGSAVAWGDVMGGAPVIALPLGMSLYTAVGSSWTLAANGGAVAIPVVVSGPMKVQDITIHDVDSGLTRSVEAQLYGPDDNSSATLDAVTDVYASATFTGATVWKKIAITTPGTIVSPGVYWLVVRNTNAANVLTIKAPTLVDHFSEATVGVSQRIAQMKTISALGATLDMTAAGWIKYSHSPAALLSGRALAVASNY